MNAKPKLAPLRDKDNGECVGSVMASEDLESPPISVQPLRQNRIFISLLLLSVYVLLLSDAIRSDNVYNLKDYVQFSPFMYALFGPYAYPVLNISRSEANVYTGSKRGESLNNAKLWSYKYDTSSISMRATASKASLKSWPSCVFYKESCQDEANLSLKNTFHMVDDLIDVHKHKPAVDILHPSYQSNAQPKFVGIIANRIIDKIFHILGDIFMQRQTITSVRVWYLDKPLRPNVNGSRICDSSGDTPMLCTIPEANYKLVTGGKISSIKNPVVDSEIRMMKKLIENPRHTVEGLFLETHRIPPVYIGGYLSYRSWGWDGVLFMRVRDCMSGKECKTVQVDDYRYEGYGCMTNAESFTVLLKSLRYFAQGYYYIRLFCLLIGIYRSKLRLESGDLPQSFRQKVSLTFHVLLQVPNQVVIYGSVIPVFFYTIAHCFDSAVLHSFAGLNLASLQGAQVLNIEKLINAVTAYMRSVWLMGSIACIFVYFQTSNNWNRKFGIIGIRGHTFAMLSFLSITMGYRHVNLRNSQVISISEASPLRDIIGISTRKQPYQTFGIISDILAVISTCLIFSILRWLFLMLHRKFISPTAQIPSINGFIHTTKDLPISAGILWNPSSLCVAWRADKFLKNQPQSIVDMPDEEKEDQAKLYRHVLMNIAILSDPARYFTILFSNILIYAYKSKNGHYIYATDRYLLPSTERIVEIRVSNLSWHQIIRIT